MRIRALRVGSFAVALGAAGLALATFAPGPALADGGPHVLANNNGISGLAGDCAACHRAHTAQASDLLRSALPGLCLECHDGTAATTNVVDGYQFVPDGTGAPTAQVLGALRGGGFSYALIDSSHPARLIEFGRFLGKVGVLPAAAAEPVTSTHGGTGTVWGNGPDGTAGAGAGPADLTCTSCHNPHGNGQYRILQTLPGEDWSASPAVPGWDAPTQAVEVAETVNPTNAVRNYTVLPGNLASDVVIAGYLPTQGDYWRLRRPWFLNTGVKDNMQVGWDGTSPTNAAANGGDPPLNASGLMTAWCISCHTRYSGLVDADFNSSSVVPQPDAIFTYRHLTMTYGCEQCHVSHGSNALMTTNAELDLTDPAGGLPAPIPGAGPAGNPVTSGDSRLLKLDDRGTCQLCHDPTRNVPQDGYVGPIPTPGTP
jgi:predicted CXXCH cytochrome family protein